MEDKKSLKTLYKEQLDLYPKLSQEEIVTLYESEGISNETIDETLKKLNILIDENRSALSSLTNDSSEDRLFRAIHGDIDPKQEKIDNLKKVVDDLEKKANELHAFHKEILDLLPSFNSTEDNIEKALEILNQEIETKKLKIEKMQTKQDSLNNQKDKKIDEVKAELELLEKKANNLKRTYKTYSHKFYISTRGIMPKNRKFPSNELRNKIVCGTLGLARYYAGMYYRKYENTTPIDDLIQIANEALMSAAHYYIPSDAAKFTTYARRCIENKLKREIYNRRKTKKRTCKPDQFFQKEKDKVAYIQMFLEALKTKSKSGKTYYYSDKYIEAISVILFRFKDDIKYHNFEMKIREENYRLLPSYSGRGNEEKMDIIVQRITKMINESKIETLITDDDRELANILVNYKGINKDTQEIYQFIYYLESYLQKLDLIERYLKAQEKLTIENDYITPTDDEILEELNKQIKLDNKERYKLKKENFFEKRPMYKNYYNYYSEYKELYNVDPFITPEAYEEDEYYYSDGSKKFERTLSSKKKERDDIISDFNKNDIISNLNEMIEDINKYYGDDDDLNDCESEMIEEIDNYESENEKIVLFLSDGELEVYEDWEEFKIKKDYFYGGTVFSKNDGIKELITMRETISKLTEEEYVKMILKKRKDTINSELERLNAPLLKGNKIITQQLDKYNLGERYKRHLKHHQIAETKKDIELLFGDDSELLILMNSSRNKNKWHYSNNTFVEDEALNNVFLEDYYESLNQLPEIERQVLLKYFDEFGIHSMTAKEIGAELDITESQVYKVKRKALEKLSKNPKLQNYNI